MKLYIINGPPASGKSTIIYNLVRRGISDLESTIIPKCTTRPVREDEKVEELSLLYRFGRWLFRIPEDPVDIEHLSLDEMLKTDMVYRYNLEGNQYGIRADDLIAAYDSDAQAAFIETNPLNYAEAREQIDKFIEDRRLDIDVVSVGVYSPVEVIIGRFGKNGELKRLRMISEEQREYLLGVLPKYESEDKLYDLVLGLPVYRSSEILDCDIVFENKPKNDPFGIALDLNTIMNLIEEHGLPKDSPYVDEMSTKYFGVPFDELLDRSVLSIAGVEVPVHFIGYVPSQNPYLDEVAVNKGGDPTDRFDPAFLQSRMLQTTAQVILDVESLTLEQREKVINHFGGHFYVPWGEDVETLKIERSPFFYQPPIINSPTQLHIGIYNPQSESIPRYIATLWGLLSGTSDGMIPLNA